MALRQQLLAGFRAQRSNSDFWIHCLLYACLLLAFWPITTWVATSAHEQSRIFHALVVLMLATVFLVRYGGVQIQAPYNSIAAREDTWSPPTCCSLQALAFDSSQSSRRNHHKH